MSDLTVSLLNPMKTVSHGVAKSVILTSLIILTPMVAMFTIALFCEYSISTIIVNNTEYSIQEYRHILLSPIYVIASITWISGFIALVAIRFKVQSFIKICSYVYTAIGYWCILNIIILVFTAWSYLTSATIGHIFLWASPVALIWLFSAAVMNAYAEDMSIAINEMV